MIHHARFSAGTKLPAGDYKPPRSGRLVIPWHLHPKSVRGAAFQASDLTPWIPPIGNQDQIGECTGYGTKDGIATTMAKAGHPLPGYFAALPIYRMTRAIERAAYAGAGALPPLTDSGASPDDVLHVAQTFGLTTSAAECGEAGPSDTLSQYEDTHVNDEPVAEEFIQSSAFRVIGGFDIVSTGAQRVADVAQALAAGYAVGISVYAADARFQNYVGGVMPDPPAGSGCDHWNYLAGAFLDATGAPIFVGVNSWTAQFGQPYGSAKGGCWLGGAGILQASDCLIAFAITGVQQ